MNLFEACEILGVDTDASIEEVKKIYKKGMLKYHPDKRLNDPKDLVKYEYDRFTEAYNTFNRSKNPDFIDNFEYDVSTDFVIILGNYFSNMFFNVSYSQVEKTQTYIVEKDIDIFDYFTINSAKQPITCPVKTVNGTQIETNIYNIILEPPKTEYKFPGKGNLKIGCTKGDLIIKFNIISKPYYRYKWNDEEKKLIITEKISKNKFLKYRPEKNLLSSYQNYPLATIDAKIVMITIPENYLPGKANLIQNAGKLVNYPKINFDVEFIIENKE